MSPTTDYWPRLGAVALAVVCIAGGASVALYWAAALDRQDAHQRLAEANETNLQLLEQAYAEFDQLGHYLAEMQSVDCSSAMLDGLRRYLFTLKYLRDVGIVRDNHLLCSTALGVIEQPVQSSAPDFVLAGGVQVYPFRRVRVSERQPTMVLQRSDHNALVDPGLIASLSMRAPVGWTWIQAAGDPAIYPLFAGADAPPTALRDRRCSATRGFCLVAAGREDAVVHPYRRPLYAALGGGTGLALFLGLQMMMWRRCTPQYLLRRAIRDGRLAAVYQPIVDLPSGRVTGFELLARWPDAPENLRDPERFVAQAEDLGLITALTEAMVRRAAREVGDFLARHPELYLAINVSAADLADGALDRLLTQEFVARGVQAEQIVLELTERSLAGVHREQIVMLQRAGFRILIDDLGEGYSNLSYLHELKPSGVKVGRSFSSGLGTDSPKVDLVRAMIQLARAMDLNVIIEGIETRQAHLALQRFGTLHGQGFLYAKPMPAEMLVRWIEAAEDVA